MKALVKDSGDILFGVVLLAHLISSPYAKVEESFNLQAVHDILERKRVHCDHREARYTSNVNALHAKIGF